VRVRYTDLCSDEPSEDFPVAIVYHSEVQEGVSRLCHKHTGQCVMVDDPNRDPCNGFNCSWMRTFCGVKDL